MSMGEMAIMENERSSPGGSLEGCLNGPGIIRAASSDCSILVAGVLARNC